MATPSQTLNTVVNSQNTTLNIYQKTYGLFMDVYLNNGLVIAGVICEDGVLIVRNTYLGYSGDFAFVDTQGTSDPVYTGLGARFQLFYLYPSDLSYLPSGVS